MTPQSLATGRSLFRTRTMWYGCLVLVRALALATPVSAQRDSRAPGPTLDASTKLETVNARAFWTTYRGRPALKLAPREGHERDTDQEMFAVLAGSDFTNGVIEVDVSGARRQGYSTAEDVSGFKGIVGLSFRVRGNSAERFYVRPENARLNNQLFRTIDAVRVEPRLPLEPAARRAAGDVRVVRGAYFSNLRVEQR